MRKLQLLLICLFLSNIIVGAELYRSTRYLREAYESLDSLTESHKFIHEQWLKTNAEWNVRGEFILKLQDIIEQREQEIALLTQELDIPDDELNESATVLETPGADGPRSGKWASLARHRKEKFPNCQWLGCTTPQFETNQHHMIPVHWAKACGHPWLELYEDNIITLCHNHHCSCGHGGNYKRLNLDILHDCKVGKFNSRGLSTWPGEVELLKFLRKTLGAPRPVPPDECPLLLIDPLKAKEETSVCTTKTTMAA